MCGAHGHFHRPHICYAFHVVASTSARDEASTGEHLCSYGDCRLGRVLTFSVAIALVVRHSSASISRRVSLFLFEISFAAARTSFSYRSLARTRAAGSASSGGSTTQVMTYFSNTSVRATCTCASVCRCCPCFARFVSV